ncbi:hypothetical protein [Mesobacillus maritimus]|uniref:hypothetical protein n=1 Tax=Mesobacillus maritimus TaxID=1643336 RepID=UPI00384A6F06
MGYFNDDVAGLFTSDGKRRDDVAGAFTGRRRKRDTGDVAGVTDRRRKRDDDDVLGTFDNFKIPVKAFVDSEDICRAVRRCLINDLVAGIRDEDDDDRKKRRRRR